MPSSSPGHRFESRKDQLRKGLNWYRDTSSWFFQPIVSAREQNWLHISQWWVANQLCLCGWEKRTPVPFHTHSHRRVTGKHKYIPRKQLATRAREHVIWHVKLNFTCKVSIKQKFWLFVTVAFVYGFLRQKSCLFIPYVSVRNIVF